MKTSDLLTLIQDWTHDSPAKAIDLLVWYGEYEDKPPQSVPGWLGFVSTMLTDLDTRGWTVKDLVKLLGVVGGMVEAVPSARPRESSVRESPDQLGTQPSTTPPVRDAEWEAL